MSRIQHLFDLISRRPQQKTRPFSGFYPVLSASELLEPHRELVDKIRQYFGVPESVWASTHEQLLHNFARRVQLLPASEAHHHTEPGGLLRHALETVNRAMKIRRGYMLPNGASSECISEQQEIWNFAVLCAALLHGIGKPITAVRISLRDREGRALHCSLACDDLPAGGSYRPEFCRGQQEQHHQSIPLLIAGQIIPKSALQWLSQYPEVFNLWLLTLSGRYTEAGMLGEIITRADQYATPKPLPQNVGNQRLHSEAESESHPSDQPVATSRRAKEKQAGQDFLQWMHQQIVDDNKRGFLSLYISLADDAIPGNGIGHTVSVVDRLELLPGNNTGAGRFIVVFQFVAIDHQLLYRMGLGVGLADGPYRIIIAPDESEVISDLSNENYPGPCIWISSTAAC